MSTHDKPPRLTPTEQRILRELAIGAGYKEIAALQGNSQETVKRHVYNLCEKLGARNRTHAVSIMHLRRIAVLQAEIESLKTSLTYGGA